MTNRAESASYLKMLDAANAATTQAACKANPYGIWQDGICRFAIFGNDAWVSVFTPLVCLLVWEPASRGLAAQPRLPPSLARRQLDLIYRLYVLLCRAKTSQPQPQSARRSARTTRPA